MTVIYLSTDARERKEYLGVGLAHGLGAADQLSAQELPDGAHAGDVIITSPAAYESLHLYRRRYLRVFVVSDEPWAAPPAVARVHLRVSWAVYRAGGPFGLVNEATFLALWQHRLASAAGLVDDDELRQHFARCGLGAKHKKQAELLKAALKEFPALLVDVTPTLRNYIQTQNIKVPVWLPADASGTLPQQLSKCFDEFVEELAGLQGQRASRLQGEAMAVKQRLLFQWVLTRGARDQADLWTTPLAEGFEDNCDERRAFLARALDEVSVFRRQVQETTATTAIARALRHLTTLARDVDKREMDLPDALFADFVIGLCIFEVAAHIGPRLLCGMNVVHGGRQTFPEGLQAVFSLHDRFLQRVWEFYEDRPAVLGQAIHDAWQRAPEEFRLAVRGAVSLRAGDSDSRQFRQRMTLAQIMHWEGWGGNGALLRDLESQELVISLLKVLRENEMHAFNWHGLQPNHDWATHHFCERQAFFRDAAQRLTQEAAACTASLLVEPRLQADSSPGNLRVWADGVGPTAFAESKLLGAMVRARGLDPTELPRVALQVELVRTEVSAPALATLLRRREGDLPAETFWRDLNLPFPGEPSFEGRPGHCAEAIDRTYDLYSCAVCLHQIADGQSGHARLREILGFATRIVRPGGVISLPDVGRGVALQVFLLPINLVDREGGFGADPFSSVSVELPAPCRFSDAAYDGRSRQFLSHQGHAPADARFKVPLPLPFFRRGGPAVLDARQLPIYEFVPLLVVELTVVEIRKLDEHWPRCAEVERGKLAKEALRFWRPELDVERLIADVNARCFSHPAAALDPAATAFAPTGPPGEVVAPSAQPAGTRIR